LFQGGKAITLCDRDGERVIPSLVHIDEQGGVTVGRPAKNVAVLHPERTIRAVKRVLAEERCYWINGREYCAEQIASFIIKALKKTAEEHSGRPVHKAVVTVPAYFDDRKRQALKRAAQLAGLEVARLLNEPTAAALAHGLHRKKTGLVVVYDLGGGTFDVSVLRAADGVFQVLATRGDTRLGGDDFDHKIAVLLLERFGEETGIDLRKDRLALQKVYQEAERAKIKLSTKKSVQIEIPFIAADDRGPCHLNTRLSRGELEELIGGYLDKTLRLTRGALKDAGLGAREIDRILMVGGSTRIPALSRALGELFGKRPEQSPAADELVARGAAVQGGILSGKVKRTALVDVTPLGLGVEAAGDEMVEVVARNTVLPVRSSAIFTTVSDYQKNAEIRVLQGERPRASDNIDLGSFQLQGLLPGRKGDPRIEVSFDIDVDGLVHVLATDVDTGSSRSISLEGSGSLPTETAVDMLVEARASELEDRIERSLDES
jgi:molecular chaperone DnaK